MRTRTHTVDLWLDPGEYFGDIAIAFDRAGIPYQHVGRAVAAEVSALIDHFFFDGDEVTSDLDVTPYVRKEIHRGIQSASAAGLAMLHIREA